MNAPRPGAGRAPRQPEGIRMSGTATAVAVIGMSCRFPGVDGLDAFWRLLTEGQSTRGTFPPRRAADARPF
ncbi:beta-ketoacyl synthase N-terminal-like domain-containing protein, partial [Streptomyces anthocyanicus]|uniref:beta-ketoacyl synthase N-terminal-like domain-containing protein n=1 Tax=Streptomyces anthocyanicus TaxID=68174 RepID=UPI0036613E82